MRSSIIILLAILSSTCSKNETATLPRLKFPLAGKVIRVNTKEMLISRSSLLAINFTSDTTILKNPYRIKDEYHVSYGDTTSSSDPFKIFVDTSYAFYSKGFNYSNHRLLERNEDVISSYPVLVYNASSRPQLFYQPNLNTGFSMIQEALDTDGQWKPIEFTFDFIDCGNAHTNYILLPKNYIASAIIKYSGDFKTKIRVKIRSFSKVYYSNEISGTINRSQFDTTFVPAFLKDNKRWYEGNESIRKEVIDHLFLNYKY